MGAYMAADEGPRETLRREMKYERLGHTLRNDDVRRAIRDFLLSPTRSLAILASCEDRLRAKISEAASTKARDNLTHQMRALNDFRNGLNELGIHGLQLWTKGHVFRPLSFEGVTISVQPYALVRQVRMRGRDQVGALLIDVAKGPSCKTDEAARKVEKAMIYSAILLRHIVSDAAVGPEEISSPEHCVVFHAHRAQRVAAPANYKTLMRNMLAECRDIRRAWNDIEAPPSFDPSRAQYRA